MPTFQFTQVNVFSADPLGGNPLAVVHAAKGLSEAQMAALARWTNLSETTFLLPPTDPGADYYVRIFTPGGELPFAGHPTLGSCHAWLAAGGKPRKPDLVVQQCGLVRVRCDGPRLEFAAPPLRRTGVLEPDVLAKITKALALLSSDIVHHQWVDNGPGWCAVMLRSAHQVLSLKPD
jgi:PhzF family phenazine biosynthesis protein